MSEPVKPALTPEQWEAKATDDQENTYRGSGDHEGEGLVLLDEDGRVAVTYDSGMVYTSVREEERHALAALALHGQPFGFTHEDVLGLELLISQCESEWLEGEETRFLRSLKSRIEALLPPEVQR